MEASKSCHCKPWGKSIFENQSVVWLRWVFDGSFRETSSDDLDHLYGAPELLVTGSRHQSLIRWEIVLRSLHVLLFDEWVLSWIMKPVLLKLWFAMQILYICNTAMYLREKQYICNAGCFRFQCGYVYTVSQHRYFFWKQTQINFDIPSTFER